MTVNLILRIVAVVTAAVLPLVCAAAARGQSAPAADAQKHLRELVREFTFEDSMGGELPLHWRRETGRSFPAYTKGKIDATGGHESNSSFLVELKGGNCIYRYDTSRTAIDPAFDYYLEGWIKTAGLKHSGARLTAWLCDQQGRILDGSAVATRFVSGDSDWTLVRVSLSPEAATNGKPYASSPRTVGLAMEVFGGEIQDISGMVWFDDLRLYRLPRLKIALTDGRLVFSQGEPVVVKLSADGLLGASFPGRLTVRTDRGNLVHEQSVTLTPDADGVARVTANLPALPPNAYDVTYDLASDEPTALARYASFAVLAPLNAPPQYTGAGLGLADISGVGDPEQLATIVQQLGVGAVKVPLWRRDTTEQEIVGGNPRLERFLNRLHGQRLRFIGLLDQPPEYIARMAREPGRGLADLVTAKDDLWGKPLGYTVSRYAGIISAWQLGGDSDPTITRLHLMPDMFDPLTRQMDRLTAAAPLGIPWPAFYALPAFAAGPGSSAAGAALPPTASQEQASATPAATTTSNAGLASRADFISVRIGPEITPDQIQQYLPESVASRRPRTKIYLTLDPISRSGHDPDERIVDLAMRVLAAKQAGVEEIFFSRLVDPESGLFTAADRPSELFVVARTLCDMLGGTRFAGWMPLEHNAAAMVFERPDGAELLVLWKEDIRVPVKEPLSLGEQLVQVDLWGNRTLVPRLGSVSTVTLQAMPLFVTGIDPQITRTRRSFRLQDSSITAAYRKLSTTVEFTNGFDQPITGLVRLLPPKGWNVDPQTIRFALAEGEQLVQPLTVVVPYNETVGLKDLAAEFDVTAKANYRFVAVARVHFDMAAARVRATAFLDQDDLVIEQEIFCTAHEPTSFQAYVQIPGRPMLNHFIPKLRPGESVTRRYRLPYTSGMEEKVALVGLRDETLDRGFANLAVPLRGVRSGAISRQSTP